jgi:hypothetical protein
VAVELFFLLFVVLLDNDLLQTGEGAGNCAGGFAGARVGDANSTSWNDQKAAASAV